MKTASLLKPFCAFCPHQAVITPLIPCSFSLPLFYVFLHWNPFACKAFSVKNHQYMSPNCSWPLEHLDQRRIYFYWKQTRNMRKWWRASRIGKVRVGKRENNGISLNVFFPAWKAIWQKMLRWPVHLHVPILWASDGPDLQDLRSSQAIRCWQIQQLGVSIHWDTICSALHLQMFVQCCPLKVLFVHFREPWTFVRDDTRNAQYIWMLYWLFIYFNVSYRYIGNWIFNFEKIDSDARYLFYTGLVDIYLFNYYYYYYFVYWMVYRLLDI